MSNKISVSGNILNQISFSLHQNHVPIIRNLVITNNTEEVIRDISVHISFEPEFAHTFEGKVEQILPSESVEISPVNIAMVPEYLFSLTEKLVGNIHILVRTETEELYTKHQEMELLAYDQWTGYSIMPEMLCSFITPNHPAITQLITKAIGYLQQWGGNPSFTAYQTQNPNEVKKQIAAIYAVLQSENINYMPAPASYENAGQRIRMPSDILNSKIGTCIDLALLFASCLEAIGLHSLICIMKGHAFVGCWLEEETFPDCIQDDASAIMKRFAVGMNELCMIECTDVVAGKKIDIDMAEKHGEDHFIHLENFVLAIDVARCRYSGIRPLPMRVVVDGQYEARDYGTRKENDITTAPSEVELGRDGIAGVQENITKQKLWERKLLDLSMRNQLLNFRVTSNTVQLMATELHVLEDAITNGTDFKIAGRPAEWVNTLRDSKIFEIENETTLIESIASSEFKSKRIRTFLDESDLDQSLKKLQRRSKVSLEENGVNTLYVALGFLRWYETDVSEKPRYAPLVLVPVDIVRKVQEKAYIIRSRGEDAQVNITLLEMLRQDFEINITGLDPLPLDDSGIDLQLVFNTIRQGIMSKKRWDIEMLSFIGLFSFGQFIMWNDIRNRSEDLQKNKIVSSLISGKMEWEPVADCPGVGQLDDNVKPSDLAVPSSVDSSQLVAICSAAKGQSFVLHGPPGTGKSQTITNMIANALYQGKRVLFVAEKMAALNVVQKRLEKIGLGPFCLEIHSNKSNKKAVLDQMSRTLDVGHIKSPEEYEETSNRIQEIRKQLNVVIQELHEVRDFGFSVFDGITTYETEKANYGKVKLSKETLELSKQNKHQEWKEIIENCCAAGEECGTLQKSCFKYYQNRNYSLELRGEFKEFISNYRPDLLELRRMNTEICSYLQVQDSGDYQVLTALKELLFIISNTEILLGSVVNRSDIAYLHPQIEELLQKGMRKTQLQGQLLSEFEANVLSFDANTALFNWKKAETSWLIPKMTGQSKLVKELKLYAKNASTISNATIVSYYNMLIEYGNLNNEMSQVNPNITALFEVLWNPQNQNWDMLQKAYYDSYKMNSIIYNPCFSLEDRNALLSFMSNGLSEMSVLKQSVAPKSAELERLYHNVLQKEEELKTKYIVNTEAIREKEWIHTSIDLIDQWLDNIDGLKAWSTLLQLTDQANDAGLNEVMDAYWKHDIDETNMLSAFECNLAIALVIATIDTNTTLANFQGVQFDELIHRYNTLNSEFEALTIQEMVAKLSMKVPSASGNMANSSEMGILQRAIRSNGRMLSIRKLFDSIPNLLCRMKPCMLMSPLSVAQYIDPNFPKFDFVIFDEASQIPTSGAVGAIARGDNVIVVGDPNQLPPTSFFKTNQVDEDNYDKEDLESLLDDCLALNMPQIHLLWHYRSRHESLIAYSNMQYYDNKLYTFPSPNDLISKVQLVPVEGFYDKGNTRTNPSEAAAVIDEIVRRLNDEELCKESIGVVTFSVVQQNLIEDLLVDAFVKEPRLEDIANEMHEPIFIKNLENVQGDERDAILFSICYGPTEEGKVSMNFGPLNSEGGWRRLNVAISRARKSMTIFSTLRPEQIDLGRTRSEGVVGLKGFLEFAKRGTNVLAVKNSTVVKKDDSMERIIAEHIEKLGYKTKYNIGSSQYRIDIGVINPKGPDSYILGIILDGENYKNSGTSRDRNISQPSVLRNLGWNILHIWILDWLDSSDKVMNKISAKLKEIEENGDAYTEVVEVHKTSEIEFEKFEKIEELNIVAQSSIPYESVDLGILGTSESFYQSQNTAKIRSSIEKIVAAEAPISKKLLSKKLVNAWQMTRVGSKVDSIIEGNLNAIPLKLSRTNNELFIWHVEQDPNTYSQFRVSETDKRTMDDICQQEVANAVTDILRNQISISKTDLIRETAKLFGFSRLGATIETSVSAGIEEAVKRGHISVAEDGERISVIDAM